MPTYRLVLARILVFLAGIIALCLSARGLIAGVMFDGRDPRNLLLWLVLAAPLLCWIAALWSVRVSFILFALDFVGLWATRAFLIRGNPEPNPFDLYGCEYFLPLACMAVTWALARGRTSEIRLSDW